ncbi:MAG: hypothetical protein RLZZ399_542 [Verrucomicrobiota bacterium]|jgi:multidrug efflux pump subunit AcrB
MNLAHFALRRSRLTFFAALVVLFAGTAAYLDFPAQEEPELPVRAAAVAAYLPGLPILQVEQLLARPIEERFRSIPEVKHVSSRVRMGQVLSIVELDDRCTEPKPVWQRLRARMSDVAGLLPAGARGPFVDEEYGRVAVASIALTGRELTPAELRREACALRDRLCELHGVQSVTFHGLPEEAVYLEPKGSHLEQSGLTLQSVIADLQRQNVVLPGGQVRAGTLAIAVTPTGDLRSVDDLRRLPLTLPGGGSVPLGELVEVRRSLLDPPENIALHNGERAVVLAVSMREGLNVISFGRALRNHLGALASALPAGTHAEFVTFQADVVEQDLSSTKRTFYETLVIVIGVVVAFIGWRAGWIVGVTVPLTLLTTLLVMRFLGISLNNVTLAALIISLGLLVDNGIVIAEDILRRLATGEERSSACIAAGATLAIPLLTATLACIAAFLPLMLMKSAAGDYTRPLAWVITIALLASWIISLLLVPLLSYSFAKAPSGHASACSNTAFFSPLYRSFQRAIVWVQSHRLLYVCTMGGLVGLAVFASLRVPAAFLAESNRRQLRLFWELPSGTRTDVTIAQAREISEWLRQNGERWHVSEDVTFIGDGGPRFVHAIDPPEPTPHTALALLNLTPDGDIATIAEGLQQGLEQRFPQLRLRVARFSFGAHEAGTLLYRITGPNLGTLRSLAQQHENALLAVPGTIHIRNDWEPLTLRASVEIDQARARLAGLTTSDVAQALQGVLGGEPVSQLREADRPLPILWRAGEAARSRPENLGAILVSPPGAPPVPLSGIARVDWIAEPALIQRHDFSRSISVTARNPGMSADTLAKSLAPALEAIKLPPGYRVKIGGELEESAEANSSLGTFLPLALLLLSGIFVWQFNSLRKLLIILLSVPFCFVGVVAALTTFGGKFDFMASLGLLALGGIIVSNAVLLLEQIEEELASGAPPKEALVTACLRRVRPILMTKLTCILGLLPLYLFGGALWENLALTVSGGLAMGTPITLGLVPALYSWLFLNPRTASTHPAP